MELLTIGAFARASRLSAKALRRYDELGLLPPARTDPYTGYRYYTAAQLERARLVAWLRRIGMPLARIGEVCDADASDAADLVRAYWAQVEAETEARRDLATFLIDQLIGKETDMSTAPTLGIRYAALTDAGLVRASNQDTAYAGSRLLAVADGYGSGGTTAGEAAVNALKVLEAAGAKVIRAGDLLNALGDAVDAAHREAAGLQDSGTTLTAMLWTGSQLALVHIGDSRAYVLRDGALFQITHDHTMVQAMIDEGTLTPDEARSHPQRTLLLRALGTEGPPSPDLKLYDAEAGDRYLLCSDGLSTVVPDADVERTLGASTDPDETVRALIALAHEAGAPDNVACVVADVVTL
ncbi:MerR family transcriptional regulator [Streptomyces sp. NPDC050738]|uniref:MerR family transcriptional regulator n=1 Tax=Streptomyces sp. NPDC050738 TaxID=3154744 RepID=UPI0034443036